MRLVDAIALIPPGIYLMCRTERGEENDGSDTEDPKALYLTACLMEEPPPEGFTDCSPVHRFDDRALVDVSADHGDVEAFERLAIGMVARQFAPQLATNDDPRIVMTVPIAGDVLTLNGVTIAFVDPVPPPEDA